MLEEANKQECRRVKEGRVTGCQWAAGNSYEWNYESSDEEECI